MEDEGKLPWCADGLVLVVCVVGVEPEDAVVVEVVPVGVDLCDEFFEVCFVVVECRVPRCCCVDDGLVVHLI